MACFLLQTDWQSTWFASGQSQLFFCSFLPHIPSVAFYGILWASGFWGMSSRVPLYKVGQGKYTCVYKYTMRMSPEQSNKISFWRNLNEEMNKPSFQIPTHIGSTRLKSKFWSIFRRKGHHRFVETVLFRKTSWVESSDSSLWPIFMFAVGQRPLAATILLLVRIIRATSTQTM